MIYLLYCIIAFVFVSVYLCLCVFAFFILVFCNCVCVFVFEEWKRLRSLIGRSCQGFWRQVLFAFYPRSSPLCPTSTFHPLNNKKNLKCFSRPMLDWGRVCKFGWRPTARRHEVIKVHMFCFGRGCHILLQC